MNKYVLKATGTFALFVVVTFTVGFLVRVMLDYLNPTPSQLVGAFMTAVVAYLAYVFISIQADIYRRLDELNKNK
jgi:hypothetical protein